MENLSLIRNQSDDHHVVSIESDLSDRKMSGTLGNDDFYQNLLQYMNQNTQYETISPQPMSFSPHEAEKHGRDEIMTDENDSKRRGAFPSDRVWQEADSVFLESAQSNGVDSGSDETDLKPKKKPGRKMMTTEPANVRSRPTFSTDFVVET